MRREFKWSKENSKERNASGKATKTQPSSHISQDPVPNWPTRLCGRKATLNQTQKTVREAKAKRDLVTLVDAVETTVLMGDKAADSTHETEVTGAVTTDNNSEGTQHSK